LGVLRCRCNPAPRAIKYTQERIERERERERIERERERESREEQGEREVSEWV